MNPHPSQAEAYLGGPLGAAGLGRVCQAFSICLGPQWGLSGLQNSKTAGSGSPTTRKDSPCPLGVQCIPSAHGCHLSLEEGSFQVWCWPAAHAASGALAWASSEARGPLIRRPLHFLPSAWGGGQDPVHADSSFLPRSCGLRATCPLPSFVCWERGFRSKVRYGTTSIIWAWWRGWWGGWKASRSLNQSGAIWVPTCM